MRTFLLFTLVILCFSCSDEEKPIDVLFEEVERGVILRNISRESKDFIHQDFESEFSILIEEQDIEEGALLDFVEIFVSFVDRTSSNGNQSQAAVVLDNIPAEDFFEGPNGLVRHQLSFSYQEVIDALSLDANEIFAGDIIKVRLAANLLDGRIFSTQDASASILTDECFFKSPYAYEIVVLEPFSEDQFTGQYSFSLQSDGSPLVPSTGFVDVIAGGLPNTRLINLFGEGLEITLAGDNIYPKIFQSVNLVCETTASHVLSGPGDDSFGSYSIIDDTVFFVDVLIGYEGFVGVGNGTPQLVRYRFTKQ